ncbi:unnamed protein product [Toxocara canis]|uniref:Gag/pol protein n=1 Tax=Toxocara canis TaxID=6265 RepID=A0A183V653_TOXCA|nr:unnamed protein product [Toxocara canis]
MQLPRGSSILSPGRSRQSGNRILSTSLWSEYFIARQFSPCTFPVTLVFCRRAVLVVQLFCGLSTERREHPSTVLYGETQCFAGVGYFVRLPKGYIHWMQFVGEIERRMKSTFYVAAELRASKRAASMTAVMQLACFRDHSTTE